MKKNFKIGEIVIFALLSVFLLYFVLTNNTSDDNISDSIFDYEVKGEVIAIDNDDVTTAGLAAIGNQSVDVKITEGKYKNEVVNCSNLLMGQLEYDQIYHPDDHVIIGLLIQDSNIVEGRMIELDRSRQLLILLLIFAFLLIYYARGIGLKALFSFLAALFIIWQYLIPQLLSGKNALLVASFTIILLSAIILFTVAGFTRKGLSAFLGTISGLGVTILLTVIIGKNMGLQGMTAPYAQAIYFGGYFDLNMLEIFYAAILIGSSGAAMDIAMDITSAIHEIKQKKPDILRKELIKSGLTVGRDVIGTMTTTLLLAYSGSYLTLLMMFQIRGSSLLKILNMKIVAAEVMRTLIGSISLVIVAPLTAFIAGMILSAEPSDEILPPTENVQALNNELETSIDH